MGIGQVWGGQLVGRRKVEGTVRLVVGVGVLGVVRVKGMVRPWSGRVVGEMRRQENLRRRSSFS